MLPETPYTVTQPQMGGVESREQHVESAVRAPSLMASSSVYSLHLEGFPFFLGGVGGGGTAEAQRTEVISQDPTAREGEQTQFSCPPRPGLSYHFIYLFYSFIHL